MNPSLPLETGASTSLIHGFRWAATKPPAKGAPRDWVVVDGGDGYALKIARALRTAGQGASVIATRAIEGADGTDHVTVLEPDAMAGAVGDRPVMYVASRGDGLESGDALAHIEQACLALHAVAGGKGARCVVTRGAHRVRANESTRSAVGAAVWALGASLGREEGAASSVLVDLAADATDADLATMSALAAGTAGAYAVRDGQPSSRTLVATPPTTVAQRASDETPRATGADGFVIDATAPGGPSVLQRVTRPRTRPGEVEIEVLASSLDPVSVQARAEGAPSVAGWCCVGRVATLGEGVRGGLKVGELVAALVPGSAARYVATVAALVAALPDDTDPVQAAAALPSIVVATHALNGLGRLRAGDQVVVLDAATPVGLAAIQIARRAGASVIVESSTAAGRAWLAENGVSRSLDSTRPTFQSDLLQMPRGNRVNIVLYAGAGALSDVERFLAPGACVIEVVRDTPRATTAGVSDVAVAHLDPSALMRRHPQACATMLRAAVQQLGGMALPAAKRVSCAEGARVADEQAKRHEPGLIAMSFDGAADVVVAPMKPAASGVRGDGAYLVAVRAGLSGLRVARWLAEQGAGAIVLLSPNEMDNELRLATNWIQRAGTTVTLVRTEEGETDGVARALAARPADFAWRGVVADARSYDEHDAAGFSVETVRNALGSGPVIVQQLLRATAGERLDFFTVLSSVASEVGMVGYGAQAVAEAAVDALLPARHPSGCPVLRARLAPLGDAPREREDGFVDALEPDSAGASVGALLRTDATDAVVAQLVGDGAHEVDGLRVRAAVEREAPRASTRPAAKKTGDRRRLDVAN